jgi:hypothetical protein
MASPNGLIPRINLQANRLLPDNGMADAYSSTTGAVGDWVAQQRAQSVAMGLLDPDTGLPTLAGMQNAGQQYGNGMITGSIAPEMRFSAPEMQGIGAFSRKTGYAPPSVQQRPLADDYPNGAPVDGAGRILNTPEGAPLTAPFIAGRSELLAGGMAPDRGLSPASTERTGAQVGGMGLLGVAPSKLPKQAVGTFTPSQKIYTPGSNGVIRYSNKLSPTGTANVQAHEVGHLLDWVSGDVPMSSLNRQLRKVYNDLNNPNPISPGKKPEIWSPEQAGYLPHEVDGELRAEALRAYMQNPNYLKSAAPDVAKAIRNTINSDPQISKYLQFNSGAGIAAGGAAAASYNPTQTAPDATANRLAPGF